MKKIKIIIIDEDTEYLKPLINYLSQHLPYRRVIKAYNDLEVIKAELKKLENDSNCLVIIDEKVYEKIMIDLIIQPIILSKNPTSSQIHKFSSGKQILHRINQRLAEVDDSLTLKQKNDTFLSIGLYSPIGGTGVSTLSLVLSIILAQKNSPTLFISLDVNSGLELVLEENADNNLSKYFYYYLTEPELLVEKLKNNIKTYKGLSYISSFNSVIDYEEIDKEHLVGFFQLIKKELNFERIVIDFPSLLDEKNVCLMEYMDRIILVSQGRVSDLCKLEHLKKDLKQYNAENLIKPEKSILLLNQIRDRSLISKRIKNPFDLEVTGILYSDDLMIKETSEPTYKITSQVKYVLETAFESTVGGRNG